LHDLATRLAARAHLPQETALQLAAQLFGTLHEGLQADGFASLTGLGTFRVEPAQDGAQPQTLFAPDDELAALANRPFAELPEVELSPDTDLRELEAINAEFAPEEPASEPPAEEPAAAPVEEEPTESTEDTTPVGAQASSAATDGTFIEEKEDEDEGEFGDFVEVDDIEDPDGGPGSSASPSRPSRPRWQIVASVLVPVAVLAAVLALVFTGGGDTAETTADVPAADTLVAKADTVAVDTARTQRFVLNDPSEVYTHFVTDGTMDEHTIVYGDILEHLARHYYGNPYFVKYIIEYNNLPANGYTDVGTVLKIPRLKRKTDLGKSKD
ncbi:MAG: hypothetical protein J6M53_06405, partial [Bacteroidaceae bacterium]|nr:hypothetical protein [Bacteroidaceae bacterium]